LSVTAYNIEQKTPSSISNRFAIWKTHDEKSDDLIGFVDRIIYQKKRINNRPNAYLQNPVTQ